MHEISHTLGIGQTAAFNTKCAANDWATATPLLRSWDGANAKINCGGGHIWPYGLNVSPYFVPPPSPPLNCPSDPPHPNHHASFPRVVPKAHPRQALALRVWRTASACWPLLAHGCFHSYSWSICTDGKNSFSTKLNGAQQMQTDTCSSSMLCWQMGCETILRPCNTPILLVNKFALMKHLTS